MKKQNGITLIALIITIIVMLILVGVTVNVALNGGLFDTAKIATRETEKQIILEEIMSLAVIDDEGKIDVTATVNKVSEKYTTSGSSESLSVTGKNGTYNYKITETEIIVDPVDADFRAYVLGLNGEGRPITEITEAFYYSKKFIDDSETIADASTTVTCLIYNRDENLIYAKYKGKAYKIATNIEGNTESVEFMYEPKAGSKEGQDLGVVTGQSQYDGWTILYDYGNGRYEAVSPNSSSEQLSMGYSFTGYNPDTMYLAIDTYNEAIDTINEFCRNLEGLPTDVDGTELADSAIRSVGAKIDDPTSEMYMLEDIDTKDWSDSARYNTANVFLGDSSHEKDLMRMAYWNKLGTSDSYWIASRTVISRDSTLFFGVRSILNPNRFVIYVLFLFQRRIQQRRWL